MELMPLQCLRAHLLRANFLPGNRSPLTPISTPHTDVS